MIHDATVEVTCDGKGCRETLTITPEYKYHDYSGKSGFYDCETEAIEKQVKDEGWKVEDGKHYCEGCEP